MNRRSLVRVAIIAAVFTAGSTAPDAAILQFGGTLSGSNEVPPSGSAGTGQAFVYVDTVANTMNVQVYFSGLGSPTTASHIHCCSLTPLTVSAGVATTTPTFAGFPLGVTSGAYSRTFDLTQASSYNAAFITANGGTPLTAEAALIAGLTAGQSYLNVHTQQFGGGEVKALLTPVPEPATWAMMIVGFGMVGFGMRRRRQALAEA